MDFVLVIFALFGLLVLIVISLIDARSLRIPNWSSSALFIAGAFYIAAKDLSLLLPNFLTAVAACGAMALVSQCYRHARGVDGLGLGDAKLFGAFGMWVGPLWLAPILFLASSSAILFAVVRKAASGIGYDHAVPFGPFLSLAFFVCWIIDQFSVAQSGIGL